MMYEAGMVRMTVSISQWGFLALFQIGMYNNIPGSSEQV